MADDRPLTEEELEAIKYKALRDTAKYKAEIAALPELIKIDNDKRKITKMQTGRTLKALGIADKQLEEVEKRKQKAILEFMKHEPKKKSGRGNSHKVTPARQNLVLVLTACYASQSDIADILGICREMIGRHYRTEYEKGRELRKEGTEASLNFTAALVFMDKGRTNAHHLLVTNDTDYKNQNSIDHTSGGQKMPFVMMTDAKQDKVLDVAQRLVELGNRPVRNPLANKESGEVVEGEIIEEEGDGDGSDT